MSGNNNNSSSRAGTGAAVSQHVVIVLDTSVSMNQRVHGGGLLLIDYAKSAIDNLVRLRARDASPQRHDVYTLITCSGATGSQIVAVDNKPPYSNILSALKYVEARDMSDLGAALRRAFDWLHVHRMVSGVDCLGQGLLPYMIEPALILVFTDGTEFSAPSGVCPALPVPLGRSPLAGGEFFRDAHRWDQSLFALQLCMPTAGTASSLLSMPGASSITQIRDVSPHDSSLAALCETTGGRCIAVASLRALLQAVDRIATTPAGVRVSLDVRAAQDEKMPKIPSNMKQSLVHRLIHFRTGASYLWPIPDQLRRPSQDVHRQHYAGNMRGAAQQTRDENAATHMVPREAHPTLVCMCKQSDIIVPASLSADVYDLECPALAMLMRNQSASCWVLHAADAEQQQLEPIGFVKLSKHGMLTVEILPWRFPALIPIIEGIASESGASLHAPPVKWRRMMDSYCASCPPYYYGQLRAVLRTIGMCTSLVPEPKNLIITGVHAQTLAHIRQLSRVAQEREVANANASTAALIRRADAGKGGSRAEQANPVCSARIFTAPLDIPRDELISQVALFSMRLGTGHKDNKAAAVTVAKALGKLERDVAIHSVPVADMGDYLETSIRKAPPRDPRLDDSQQRSPHFGNPFNPLRSAHRSASGGSADELDEDEAASERGLLGGNSSSGNNTVDESGNGKRARSSFPRAGSPRPLKR